MFLTYSMQVCIKLASDRYCREVSVSVCTSLYLTCSSSSSDISFLLTWSFSCEFPSASFIWLYQKMNHVHLLCCPCHLCLSVTILRKPWMSNILVTATPASLAHNVNATVLLMDGITSIAASAQLHVGAASMLLVLSGEQPSNPQWLWAPRGLLWHFWRWWISSLDRPS